LRVAGLIDSSPVSEYVAQAAPEPPGTAGAPHVVQQAQHKTPQRNPAGDEDQWPSDEAPAMSKPTR
jgi:hypothetical protein